MSRHVVLGSLLLALCSCGGSDADESNDAPPPPLQATPSAERPSMSAAECEAQGGAVVGDIGDGRIHRPDYRCEDGQAPIADVPLGVEGSVCCPRPASAGSDDAGACQVDEGCQDIQCFRAVTCVRECGDEPVGCGCCPCADGFVDAIECEAHR